MNFIEFNKKFQQQKVFSTLDIAKEWPEFHYANLINWQAKGYIIKIRNTWYAFADALNTETDLYFVANRLHKPSYISLETALRFYNFIPEMVFSVTSVTTLKPASWNTPVGHFSYRTMKPELFFGYQLSDTSPAFLIADPEKTLLDMLYFNSRLSEIPDFEALRLNREAVMAIIRQNRMESYLRLIASPTLEKRWRTMKHYLEL